MKLNLQRFLICSKREKTSQICRHDIIIRHEMSKTREFDVPQPQGTYVTRRYSWWELNDTNLHLLEPFWKGFMKKIHILTCSQDSNFTEVI